MKKASICSGMAFLALCLSGCGSSNNSTEAMASESAMADTGMASEDAGGAMMSDGASPMASEGAMESPAAMGSEGAMKEAMPAASGSAMSAKDGTGK